MITLKVWNDLMVKLFKEYKICSRDYKLVYILGRALCPLKYIDMDLEELEIRSRKIIEKTIIEMKERVV